MTLATTTATLTVAEADQLADCEAVIAKGLQTFIEVGQALLTIRDNRLYRTSYGTFEEYCRKTWGMSKTHANRVIDSAEVAEVLTPIGVTPATESQARELAPLKDDPNAMRAVWETANDRTDGKPTAKVIRECREELTAEPEILDAEVVEEGEMESASRVLANDIRLWLNHLQTKPEMDRLSDREKWHVIEGLRETADVLERKIK